MIQPLFGTGVAAGGIEVSGPWKGDGWRFLPLKAVDWDQIKNTEMVSRPLSLGPRSRKTTGLHMATVDCTWPHWTAHGHTGLRVATLDK